MVEDLELPPKQRPTAARPRVPASGKIPHAPLGTGLNSSPQKRPAPPAGTGGSKPGAPEPSKKKSKKNNGTAGPSNAELGNDESSNQTKSSTSAKTLGKQKVSSTVADDKAAVISPKKSRHELSADGVVAESDSEIILSANNGNNDIKMNGSTSATVNGADPPDLAVGGSSAISGGGILSPESMSTR